MFADERRRGGTGVERETRVSREPARSFGSRWVSESGVPHCGDNDGCPESLGNGRRRFFIHAARFREGNQSGTQSVCSGRELRGAWSQREKKPNEKAPFRDDPRSPSSVARATHGRDARVPAPRAVRARRVAVGRRVGKRRRAESDRVSDASPSRGASIAPSENISTSRTRALGSSRARSRARPR